MYTKINTDMGGIALVEQPLVLSAKRCSDGNGTLSYLFFSEEWVDIQRAKAICSKCSNQSECLTGALDREEPWGVWGGEELDMGRVVGVRRPRGRPPVKARPVTAVQEVPIPRHLVA
jgi:WhiB family transcriptional regulator, redox-sensing transcriptional regulator